MFNDLQLRPELLRNVQKQGYTVPTPIQAVTIPPAMEGRDVLATAETGSGKTAAFLLPLLHRLMPLRNGRTQGLILCPTREIALQTEQHVLALGAHTGLRSAVIYGGVGFEPQIKALKSGVDIVVATPGRLLDHIGRGNLSLRNIRMLILDEADRMLDMGFIPDIRRILSHLPRKRQTMLFSATMPDEILSLANELMTDPVRLSVGRLATPPAKVDQIAYPVATDRKTDLLLHLVQGTEMKSVLVFTRTKHRADKLAKTLSRSMIKAACIHGDRSQRQREAALDGFRRGFYRVLVATDVASRGLDIQGVTHVINYDLPDAPEDYVHRVGRTARAGASGRAMSLVTLDDAAALRDIQKTIGQEIEQVVMPDFGQKEIIPTRPPERFHPQRPRLSAGPGTGPSRPARRRPPGPHHCPQPHRPGQRQEKQLQKDKA